MVLFFMLPEEIVEIIQKYQNQVSEEISNINPATRRNYSMSGD